MVSFMTVRNQVGERPTAPQQYVEQAPHAHALRQRLRVPCGPNRLPPAFPRPRRSRRIPPGRGRAARNGPGRGSLTRMRPPRSRRPRAPRARYPSVPVRVAAVAVPPRATAGLSRMGGRAVPAGCRRAGGGSRRVALGRQVREGCGRGPHRRENFPREADAHDVDVDAVDGVPGYFPWRRGCIRTRRYRPPARAASRTATGASRLRAS